MLFENVREAWRIHCNISGRLDMMYILTTRAAESALKTQRITFFSKTKIVSVCFWRREGGADDDLQIRKGHLMEV